MSILGSKGQSQNPIKVVASAEEPPEKVSLNKTGYILLAAGSTVMILSLIVVIGSVLGAWMLYTHSGLGYSFYAICGGGVFVAGTGGFISIGLFIGGSCILSGLITTNDLNNESSFQKEKRVHKSNFLLRKKVYQKTLDVSKKGYYEINKNKIKIDSSPMTLNTVCYDEVEALTEKGNFNTQFSVINDDTLSVLVKMRQEGRNPVGINMANRYRKGGGVEEGCPAQEESICRCSNYMLSLNTVKYPFPENGGIYSPHVQVFRKKQDEGFEFMDKPEEVALVAIAAYDLRAGSKDRVDLGLNLYGKLDLETLKNCKKFMDGTKNKIRNMLRTMSANGHTEIVLGALGCGAFENPPTLVTQCFFEVFKENDEFAQCFQRVDFAVLIVVPRDRDNYDAFATLCDQLNS